MTPGIKAQLSLVGLANHSTLASSVRAQGLVFLP